MRKIYIYLVTFFRVLNPFTSLKKFIFCTIVYSLSFTALLNIYVENKYSSDIYSDKNKIPTSDAALVLGAGIWQGKRPSHILEDRIKAGVELYKSGKVKKLIVSGALRYGNSITI